VILGGGFGGLYCARALRGAPVDIILIDRRNYHLFQPLLYQVATASLSPADVASPIRAILKRQENVDVWLAEATDIDTDGRAVTLRDGRITYDYLVIATGVTHHYFGNDDWATRAPGLKTVDDALEIRRRFLLAFEAAEREADADARQRLLTFVVVGGGPTGVELAGAMAEIARHAIPRDFRFIDTTAARIILLEGTDRVLPPYPQELSASARAQLERLGVDVRTDALVTDIDEQGVHIGDELIPTENVYWAAGIAASPLAAALETPLDRAGRVRVENDASVPGHPETFVIGDLAHFEQDDQPLPGVAQVAIQSGRHVARMIRNDLDHKDRTPFRYRDLGNLATIGRNAAVADFGRLRFGGYFAWLVWVFVHIFNLIGFRNRILVMIQWAWAWFTYQRGIWAWFTYQRGIRLITGSPEVELARARDPAHHEPPPSAPPPPP
jgi:NADH dehydrogenase